jgi:uncharacterized protein
MIQFVRDIFLDRHREIRPIWRILMFITLLLAVSFALLTPAQSVRFIGRVPQLVLLLLSAVLASFIMTRMVHRKRFGAFGLTLHPSTLREFLLGLGLGLAMMAGIFIVEVGTGMVSITLREMSAGGALALFAMAAGEFLLGAAFEEVVFRGYVFQVLLQWITLLPATLVIALLFALAHGFNPGIGPIAYMNIGLVSLTLCLAYYKTRGLWLPIGLHFGWNFAQTTIFGFPTSGMPPAGLSFVDLTQSGATWLTGGAFGPEAGILGTLSIVGGTWYILKSRHIRAEEGIITLDSLEDVLPEGRVTRETGTS